MNTSGESPDYGLDAPAVVRNLGIAGVVGLGIFASKALGIWSARIPLGGVTLELDGMGLTAGIACSLMCLYMIWSSKRGKLGERDQLLNRLSWTGKERVLDVGCGRGLMLIGAAKRAASGSAVGIDIWQKEDLAGNDPKATLENARIEGVAARVALETADMRKMPFPDASFDVIVSKAAIHNLYKPEDRAQALGEIARVLAPGGQLLIDDIRHLDQYQRELHARGLTDLVRIDNQAASLFFTLLTFASLRPGQLLARKPPAAPFLSQK